MKPTPNNLTAAAYKAAREAIGTQPAVAALLGVSEITLSRRENGHVPITREMQLAIAALKRAQ